MDNPGAAPAVKAISIINITHISWWVNPPSSPQVRPRESARNRFGVFLSILHYVGMWWEHCSWQSCTAVLRESHTVLPVPVVSGYALMAQWKWHSPVLSDCWMLNNGISQGLWDLPEQVLFRKQFPLHSFPPFVPLNPSSCFSPHLSFLLSSFLLSLLFLSLLLENSSYYCLSPYNIAGHQETLETKENRDLVTKLEGTMASRTLSSWQHEHRGELSIWQEGPWIRMTRGQGSTEEY